MSLLLTAVSLFLVSSVGMLLVADQPLSQSHKHDEQSDSANSEFAGDGPEEYEESDACKGVF